MSEDCTVIDRLELSKVSITVHMDDFSRNQDNGLSLFNNKNESE